MTLPKVAWGKTPWKMLPESSSFVSYIVDAEGSTLFDVRGWGRLTGQGYGALKLSEPDALNAQVELVQHVIGLVNGDAIPKTEVTELVRKVISLAKAGLTEQEILDQVFLRK